MAARATARLKAFNGRGQYGSGLAVMGIPVGAVQSEGFSSTPHDNEKGISEK